MLYFFFQAEDGIRYSSVTGVQTCALPIFYTAHAIARCRLTAHISTKLNRSHLITGERALIFPTLGRSELDVQLSGAQFVTTEDSMGIINISRGDEKPASPHLLSDVAIICRLAEATLRVRTTGH